MSDLTRATYFYGLGIDGTGSSMSVNFYKGLPNIAQFIDFAGAAVPRIIP